MTEEQPALRDKKNVWIIVLAVVVTVLLGAIIGYVATGGLSDDPPTGSAAGSTTTSLATVATTVPPATSLTQAPPPTDAPGQLTIQAIEDTYTNSSDPEDTSGFDDVLELEDDPPEVKSALVRFDTTGAPAVVVEGVTLRLFVVFSSGAAIEVHRVDGSWSETDTTASSAPAVGELIATIPPGVTEGESVEVDLTGLVTVPGPIDLYLTTSGDDTIEIASKESGATAPALIVRWTP
jgi:hypothetical protein